MINFIVLATMLFVGQNSFAGCCAQEKQCEPICQKSSSVYIPRQVAYDPVYQYALNYEKKNIANKDWSYYFSASLFGSKSTGKNLDTYFNIDNKKELAVRENGTGDIDSLWFQDIAPAAPFSFYSSQLSMHPQRSTFGALLAFDANFSHVCRNTRLEIFTAILNAKHKVNLCERDIQNLGTFSNIQTITDSFANANRLYGRIVKETIKKTGVDDIQIKLMRFYERKTRAYSLYLLLGIPTGEGTNSKYLFEPLVGSKHFNLGVGATFDKNLSDHESYKFNLLGEFKLRYAFKGKETRVFDITNNGQWSRYLLAANEEAKGITYFAINNLALDAQVTPGASIDAWLAINYNKCDRFNVELGYNFWYREREKVCIDQRCGLNNNFGIADLVGIVNLNPQSASNANISQSVVAGPNQMQSDTTFKSISISDLNPNSAAQPKSMTHKFYLSGAYNFCCAGYDSQFTLNTSYEFARHHGKMLNQVAFWAGFNFLF